MKHFAISVIISLSLGTLVAQSGWVQRAPLTSPAARNAQLLAFDFLRGVTVMFGGDQALRDTWEWNGANWTQRTPLHSPPPRSHGAFGFDLLRGRVVLFGGFGPQGTLDDTWEFDGSDWVGFTPAVRPPARLLGGLADDPFRSRMLLFGGAASGFPPVPVMSDTWTWNGVVWTQLQPASRPSARWSFAMASDYTQARIVLQGGSNNTAGLSPAFPDTWIWDGANWTQVPTAASPSAFIAMGSAYDWQRDAVVRFGGIASPLASQLSGETWLFAGNNWVQDTRSPSPTPRYICTCAFDTWRNCTVMFGGFGDAGAIGDTWEYFAPAASGWQPYGAGCAGTAGTPLLQPLNGSRPLLGATFSLDLTNVPNGAPVAFAVGFSNTSWSGGPLPFAMAPLGMPGCTMLMSPDLLTFASATGSTAVTTMLVPSANNFIGLPFFTQALTSDPAANPFGAVLSNAGAGVVGIF